MKPKGPSHEKDPFHSRAALLPFNWTLISTAMMKEYGRREIRTRGTDGLCSAGQFSVFRGRSSCLPPHFHSGVDDVRSPKRISRLQKKKAGHISDPPACLEGDSSSQGSYRAVCWDFPSVEWRERTGALWQSGGACGPENRVGAGHIVASLG